MPVKTSYINTLDGKARVEWWEKEDFHGRTSTIYSGESVDAYLKGVPLHELIPDTVIPIPDSSIVCDFCNTEIEEFPIPVVWGTHALCRKCFENIRKKGGD